MSSHEKLEVPTEEENSDKDEEREQDEEEAVEEAEAGELVAVEGEHNELRWRAGNGGGGAR